MLYVYVFESVSATNAKREQHSVRDKNYKRKTIFNGIYMHFALVSRATNRFFSSFFVLWFPKLPRQNRKQLCCISRMGAHFSVSVLFICYKFTCWQALWTMPIFKIIFYCICCINVECCARFVHCHVRTWCAAIYFQ